MVNARKILEVVFKEVEFYIRRSLNRIIDTQLTLYLFVQSQKLQIIKQPLINYNKINFFLKKIIILLKANGYKLFFYSFYLKISTIIFLILTSKIYQF